MESGGYKIVQIKRENERDIFDEVFDKSGVKYEPCQSGEYDASGIDHIDQRDAYYKYEDEGEEKYVSDKLNIEDVDFKDASTIQFKSEQVNSDFECNNQYGDVKIKIVENVPGKCELYGIDHIDQKNAYCKFEEQTMQCISEQFNSEDDCDSRDVRIEIVEDVPGKCELYYGKQVFHCKVCSKASTQLGSLKRHERSHTGERPFLCKICSKAFTRSDNLKAHERIHTGAKPFICKICSKAFARSGDLKVHEKIHTGEKPFLCKICFKVFTHSCNLKAHERIHTGVKPFLCKICSKVFIQSSNLRAHERIHTGEKPFLCKVCSKAFARLDDLKSHERIHTGEKPFHCAICSKAFTQLSNLKTHEKIHTREKPFHCAICSKAFTQLSNMKTHEKIHTFKRKINNVNFTGTTALNPMNL